MEVSQLPDTDGPLNRGAAHLCGEFVRASERLRVRVVSADRQARLIDCGVNVPGGLEAGRRLAAICMADLGEVRFVNADPAVWHGPAVMVMTDHPVAACMASQYAGWEVSGKDYFAMASGPMRAAVGHERLFDTIGHRETPDQAVGVLESDALPPEQVTQEMATKCGIAPNRLTLLVAPTHSQAGTVQVVARSIETALHKLHELEFDLSRLESGFGIAPLPPVAASSIAGIGRTNDAIIYGGQVTLYVRGDDDSLEAVGARVPSCASPDHGRPFSQIFEAYQRDFYQIDPKLFSPAVVSFVNLDSGRCFRFGEMVPQVIRESFGTEVG